MPAVRSSGTCCSTILIAGTLLATAEEAALDLSRATPTSIAALKERGPGPAMAVAGVPNDASVLYRVRGMLAAVRLEPDSSYRLVLVEPSGHKQTAREVSIVARLTHPRASELPESPALRQSLASMRAALEARFPAGEGTPNLPVVITGAASISQGRDASPGEIELDPVFDLRFEERSEWISAARWVELLVNPDFERGSFGWAGSAEAIGEFAGQPARSGRRLAWLGGNGYASSAALSQSVLLRPGPGGPQ